MCPGIKTVGVFVKDSFSFLYASMWSWMIRSVSPLACGATLPSVPLQSLALQQLPGRSCLFNHRLPPTNKTGVKRAENCKKVREEECI